MLRQVQNTSGLRHTDANLSVTDPAINMLKGKAVFSFLCHRDRVMEGTSGGGRPDSLEYYLLRKFKPRYEEQAARYARSILSEIRGVENLLVDLLEDPELPAG